MRRSGHLPKGLAATKRGIDTQFGQTDWELAPFCHAHGHSERLRRLTLDMKIEITTECCQIPFASSAPTPLSRLVLAQDPTQLMFATFTITFTDSGFEDHVGTLDSAMVNRRQG